MGAVRVLLIDDQQDFLEPMAFWMKAKGFDVLTAMEGAKGVEILRKEKVDVVFVDYRMPEMDGLETIRQIRSFNPKIPIVMLTAHADDVRLQAGAKGLDIMGLFPKMAEFEDLDHVLDAIVTGIRKSKPNGA